MPLVFTWLPREPGPAAAAAVGLRRRLAPSGATRRPAAGVGSAEAGGLRAALGTHEARRCGAARPPLGTGPLVEVAAGDSVHIPAGVPHSYNVEGDERFEFVCVIPNGPDEIRILEGP